MTTATSKSRSPHAVVAHDYRRAAERAQAAGFDGVEIHAANGWELNPTADMKVWSAPIQRGILKFTGWATRLRAIESEKPIEVLAIRIVRPDTTGARV